MQRLDHGHGLGIQRRELRFVGERVRPVGPLVYPCFNDVDLFRTERPGGGHLHAIRVPRYPVIQKAVVTVAGHHATATDDRAFPVKPQSTGLLRGPMTAHTVLPQDWQHILCEIDFSRGLGRQYPRKYQRKERRPRKSRSPHTPLLKKRNPKERHHRLAGKIAPPRHYMSLYLCAHVYLMQHRQMKGSDAEAVFRNIGAPGTTTDRK